MSKVLFRKFKEGDIIALFPEQINRQTRCVGSYMHIGQHGDADYDHIIRETAPATSEEYKPLLDELTHQVGYKNLQVVNKCKPKF